MPVVPVEVMEFSVSWQALAGPALSGSENWFAPVKSAIVPTLSVMRIENV